MILNKKILKISSKYQTPFLICDLDIIRKKYKEIKKNISGVEVFYAMKANDNEEIIKTLIKEGSSFEISSLGELMQLSELSVPAEKIMCLNPIKAPHFLEALNKYGVKIMAFDSFAEVDKIVKYAPKSQLLLRLHVDNEGSDWPLTKKFGVQATEAIKLLKYAKNNNLEVIGLTFHIGSQSLRKDSWADALHVCKEIWQEAKDMGIEFSFISLGGGIPVKHIKAIPSIKEIGESTNPVLEKFRKMYKNLRVTIEPGRGLVGDSATMVGSVVGLAKRGNENWMYLDVGVFNGLMETIENFMYEIKTEKKTKRKLFTLAGPSCDSVDVTFKNILLPEVNINDRLYILNAGAYTTVYGSKFNAFDVPKMYFINS